MSDFLPQLLFLVVGGVIAPPLLLLNILFLVSRRPLPNATTLALGYCAVVGVAGLALFDGAGGTSSTAGRVIIAFVGGLLIVLSLKSLLNAPDSDAQPPKWMESITSMSPATAFGIGVVLFPIQIKNPAIFAACVNLVATASLGPQASIVALGLVLLVFAIPVLALIGLYAVVPRRASIVLGSLRAWMEKNGRAITVVPCFVFGALFVARGLSGPRVF